MTEPSYLYESPYSSVATWENVVMIVIHTSITAAALEASVQANHQLGHQYPGQVIALTLAHTSVGLPDAALRHVAVNAIDRVREHCCAAAQVLDGNGFWASAARSIITTLERLTTYHIPRRTFGDMWEAADWLAQLSGKNQAWVQELVEAADFARSRAPATQQAFHASTPHVNDGL